MWFTENITIKGQTANVSFNFQSFDVAFLDWLKEPLELLSKRTGRQSIVLQQKKHRAM